MSGNFLEDFKLGMQIRHAVPRTLSEGDASLYMALTGARQPLHSSAPLARALGYADRPIDDMLVFNIAFGKTVPDISFNAVANLGYADLRFLEPVYAGDTISAHSEVIGLRETSRRDSGVVHVRSTATNQHSREVLTWIRWVLVKKRDQAMRCVAYDAPTLPAQVTAARLTAPPLAVDLALIAKASGGARLWDDYAVGERIDHPAGMTIDESDHTLATKLYQNNSAVHFDALLQAGSRHGRRLVYGGHVISLCRALSFDGLENALTVMAINAGSHRSPTFAGDTIYCVTEVIEKLTLARAELGALRLRMIGIRNHPAAAFVFSREVDGKPLFDPDVVLDLDYVVAMPRRH